MEKNNLACSRLGNILHLDIQKGGGYEGKRSLTEDRRDCIVHEKTNDGYKRV